MGSRYKQLGTRKIHHFIFHNQAHVSCRKLQQDRWSIYRYFPVTGKWYDYLTGDEVEVKDATQKMEIPAHSYRILTTFPCLN